MIDITNGRVVLKTPNELQNKTTNVAHLEVSKLRNGPFVAYFSGVNDFFPSLLEGGRGCFIFFGYIQRPLRCHVIYKPLIAVFFGDHLQHDNICTTFHKENRLHLNLKKNEIYPTFWTSWNRLKIRTLLSKLPATFWCILTYDFDIVQADLINLSWSHVACSLSNTHYSTESRQIRKRWNKNCSIQVIIWLIQISIN